MNTKIKFDNKMCYLNGRNMFDYYNDNLISCEAVFENDMDEVLS